MKMKANKIIEIYDSLHVIADKELDLDTACIVAENIKSITTPKEIIDGKKNAIIHEYAEKDEDGNLKQSEDGGIRIYDAAGFQEKMNGLLRSEANADLIPIPMSKLSGIEIKPITLLPLMDLLVKGDAACTQ